MNVGLFYVYEVIFVPLEPLSLTREVEYDLIVFQKGLIVWNMFCEHKDYIKNIKGSSQ